MLRIVIAAAVVVVVVGLVVSKNRTGAGQVQISGKLQLSACSACPALHGISYTVSMAQNGLEIRKCSHSAMNKWLRSRLLGAPFEYPKMNNGLCDSNEGKKTKTKVYYQPELAFT